MGVLPVWVHMSDPCGGQKRPLDPLELELQIAVSHLTWMLGTELRSSQEHYVLLTAKPFLQPQEQLQSTKSKEKASEAASSASASQEHAPPTNAAVSSLATLHRSIVPRSLGRR